MDLQQVQSERQVGGMDAMTKRHPASILDGAFIYLQCQEQHACEMRQAGLDGQTEEQATDARIARILAMAILDDAATMVRWERRTNEVGAAFGKVGVN